MARIYGVDTPEIPRMETTQVGRAKMLGAVHAHVGDGRGRFESHRSMGLGSIRRIFVVITTQNRNLEPSPIGGDEPLARTTWNLQTLGG